MSSVCRLWYLVDCGAVVATARGFGFLACLELCREPQVLEYYMVVWWTWGSGETSVGLFEGSRNVGWV